VGAAEFVGCCIRPPIYGKMSEGNVSTAPTPGDPMSQRDEYVEKMKQQLDEMNETIDRWQAKAKDAEGEAREKYEAQIAAFRERSETAREKLKEIKESGDDSWQNLRQEMQHIRDALVSSYNYFKSQF
jgi:predicted  nucleic acid-binding Zn-ribbon protein